MILTLLLCALAVVTAGFVIALVKAAIARRIGFPSGEALALGAVTNFFDTHRIVRAHDGVDEVSIDGRG